MQKLNLEQKWQNCTIRQKLKVYVFTVFSCIFLSVLFNIWVAHFSLGDFNDILGESSKSSAFVQAIENEGSLFRQYIKNPTGENEQLFWKAAEITKKSVEELPFSYEVIGEERYGITWSIKNSYEVYEEQLDGLFLMTEGTSSYIDQLYEIYDMQDYLRSYGVELMSQTLSSGSAVYQAKLPMMIGIPAVMAAAALMVILLMIRLSKAMNRTIVGPILRLMQSAKRIAQKEYEVEDIPVENQDEIGELIRAFNQMKSSMEAERRLETMKLEVLVNQVNPHFLFNTLNVIGGMAMLENAATTEKMIQALSSLFRYNLKNSSAEAALAQELKIVQDYLYIQQMRFGDRLKFEIDCTADIERTIIPTFTFQPLVENAIIHGLSQKEEGGRIRIRVWEREGMTMITVHDTGVGMSEEKLQILKQKLEEDNVSRDSIGVGNVYRRFKIMYPEGQFMIYSRENRGTLIKLLIPGDQNH